MNKTNIAWTDFTWNPITGCTIISEGCKNCYAKIVHERFNNTPFNEIVFHEDRLSAPFKRKKGAKIFIGSMTDLFHDEVPFEIIDKIIAVIALNQQHIFQILTKRPDRLYWYFEAHFTRHKIAVQATKYTNKISEDGCDENICNMEFPLKNLHIGVTAENQKEADKRIPLLLDVPASKRFVSIEPMINEINLSMLFPNIEEDPLHYVDALKGINYQSGGYDDISKLDWIIVGGESGAKSKVREMKPEWVQGVFSDCRNSNTSFFFKQWGAHTPDLKFDFENL